MLVKTVKITLSPFSPNLEVVGPMVFDVRAPYDDNSLTLAINPHVVAYEENLDTKGMDIRQATVSTDTDETQSLDLDITSKREEIITFQGKRYKIQVLNIGKETLEDQEFLNFEFLAEEQP